MKTESLTNPNTLQLSDGENFLKNIPKNILYSEITHCPNVWINADNPEVQLELDPEFSKPFFASPGCYYFSFAFDIGFTYIEVDDSENNCLSVSFDLQDLAGHHFTLQEYIRIPRSTQINELNAALFYKLFDLSIPEENIQIEDMYGCSGIATLDYVTRDDGLPPFPLLGNFLLDH